MEWGVARCEMRWGVIKLIARATSGRRGQAFTERLVGQVRKLPRDVWPMIQFHWADPKCFRAMRGHLAALPQSAAAVLEKTSREEKIETPLLVLSAADSSDAQREAQQRLVDRAAHARLAVVENTGHWIMLDRPDAVVAAIQEITAIRRALVNPSSRRADPSTDAGH